MSTTSIYRVTYHFERSGRRSSETFQDNILASGQDFNSVQTVLSNNSKIPSGHTLVIESIGHTGSVGAGGLLQ